MAAVPATTAAAALFGHAKGAFTGAVGASSGFFGAAEGGTLFLDEIGETSLDIQAALLRALESGEVQPVGEERPRRVSVRLVAATDMDLARAVEEGGFRRALLERLRGYEIDIAPLRDRREDVGGLLVHFLRQELDTGGFAARLEPPAAGERPWLPAWLVADATLYSWPGNVRELRNAARQLAIDWADAPEIPPDPEVTRLFGGIRPTASQPPPSDVADAAPTDMNEATVIEALRKNAWRPGPAAAQLGVSRSSLYAFIQRSPKIPKASSLEGADIEEALEDCEGNTREAAEQLCVTERALKLRMRELGLA
jgi:DNA-binding NtrC family response regulator